MNRVDTIIENVLTTEAGYVNDPKDRGGETNYGITAAVARANGYFGKMKDMPIGFARTVYRQRFVVVPHFDQVTDINEAIGAELIDTGVNMGPAVAAILLQRLLNAFNIDDEHYSKVFVDGRIGPVTLEELRSFLTWRGEKGVTAMLRALNGTQAARYLDIVEHDPSQRQFFFGWISNRVAM